MINKEFFGKTKNKEDVYKYTVTNGILSFSVLDFGATLYNLFVKDINNNLTDVVLMPLSLSDIESNSPYMGATVGRYANRLKNSEFVLNDKLYKLSVNDNENCLHGGVCGFDKKIWNAEEIENGIKFSLESEDGDMGFPGNVKVCVKYIIENNSLVIDYWAVSDKDTHLNLTNHSYFNMNGHNSGSLKNHFLTINSDFYIPVDEKLIPTGEILSAKDTVFDLKTAKPLTELYDHCFILSDKTPLKKAAELTGDISKISMTVYTTKPGIQVYCANKLSETFIGKENATYSENSFVCLETQYYPDSPNLSHFSNSLLKKDEIYSHKTIFEFKVK